MFADWVWPFRVKCKQCTPPGSVSVHYSLLQKHETETMADDWIELCAARWLTRPSSGITSVPELTRFRRWRWFSIRFSMTFRDDHVKCVRSVVIVAAGYMCIRCILYFPTQSPALTPPMPPTGSQSLLLPLRNISSWENSHTRRSAPHLTVNI